MPDHRGIDLQEIQRSRVIYPHGQRIVFEHEAEAGLAVAESPLGLDLCRDGLGAPAGGRGQLAFDDLDFDDP